MSSEDTGDKTLELDTANVAIARWAEEYKKLEAERDGFKEKADDFEAALKLSEERVAEFEEGITIWKICAWLLSEYPVDVFDGSSGDTGAVLIAEMRDRARKVFDLKERA